MAHFLCGSSYIKLVVGNQKIEKVLSVMSNNLEDSVNKSNGPNNRKRNGRWWIPFIIAALVLTLVIAAANAIVGIMVIRSLSSNPTQAEKTTPSSEALNNITLLTDGRDWMQTSDGDGFPLSTVTTTTKLQSIRFLPNGKIATSDFINGGISSGYVPWREVTTATWQVTNQGKLNITIINETSTNTTANTTSANTTSYLFDMTFPNDNITLILIGQVNGEDRTVIIQHLAIANPCLDC
jgi:hypothetical protein